MLMKEKISMPMPNYLTLFSEILLKLPQQKIAKVVIAILLVYIAYLFAQLTWLFILPESSNTPVVVATTNQARTITSGNVNVTPISTLNLFGLYTSEPVVEEQIAIQDAPETQLKLTLSGVVASDDKNTSAAVIEQNGKQETYGIGDTIIGTRALLEGVFNDRVLIKQAGRLETLMLDGFEYEKYKGQASKVLTKKVSRAPVAQAPSTSTSHLVDQRENKELTEQANALKADINDDPSKITDYLAISPKRDADKVVGYLLMPGKNPEFFQSSGLKSGDVAVQMNGYDLTEPSEAAQALSALKQEHEVSLLVDRNGELTEILFSIDE